MSVPTPKDVFSGKKKTTDVEEVKPLDTELLENLHERTVQPDKSETPPKKVKKPFVRREHLTDQVFKNNPQLAALKKQINPRAK